MTKEYKKKNLFDKILDDREKVVNEIIKRMEKDGLNWNKGWSPEMVAPQNPASNINYKGKNILKCFNEAINKEYKDPRWVTFNQAKDNNWQIKKGAKSVLLEKWIFEKKEKVKNEKTGEIKEEIIKLSKPIPNYFRVFNASDVNGMPPLNIKPLDKNETLEIAENFLKSSKIPVVEVAQDKAFYSPDKNKIILPLKDTFKSQESYLATALHEMVHSTGKELNRDMSGSFGDEKYAKEELVAELGSLFLQGKLGIKLEDRHVDNHTAYLKSWIKVLKDNPKNLFEAADKAEKASTLLFDNYKQYLKEHNLENTKGKKVENVKSTKEKAKRTRAIRGKVEAKEK